MTIVSQQKRIAYFDFLRVFATFAIMIQHIDPYGSKDPYSAVYVARLASDLLTRWGVPIFLMISGALFLGSESTIKKLYSHNILRIVTAFIFWSALYSVVRTVIFGYGLTNMVLEFLYGHYHMWFMCLIVELYILTPILRKILSSWNIGKYFLLILLLYASVIPQIIQTLTLVSPTIGGIAERAVGGYIRNRFHMGLFYYVCGFYLSKCRLTVRRRRIAYIFGVAGVLIAGFGTLALARATGEQNTFLLDNTSCTIVAFSVAIFVYARTHFSFDGMKNGTVSLILKLSKYSFGAYLVHALVLEMISHYLGVEVFRVGAVFSIPLMFLVICVVSFVVSAIINHIPFLKKYIV